MYLTSNEGAGEVLINDSFDTLKTVLSISRHWYSPTTTTNDYQSLRQQISH